MSQKQDIPRFLSENNSIYNRVVGSSAVPDFFNQGSIRGSDNYPQREAYFTRNQSWLANGTPPFKISVNEAKLNPTTNPLYNSGFSNRNGAHRSIYILRPNENATTLQRINPANRSGIKIETRDGNVIYDRRTPVSERPLRTHLANLKGESKILFNSAPFLTTGTALGLAAGAGSILSNVMAASGPLSRVEERGRIALDIYEKLNDEEKEKSTDLIELIQKGYEARDEREQNIRNLHPQELKQPIFDDPYSRGF